jgi:hypothetical protein
VTKITREKIDQNSLQHQKKKGVLINSAILPFRSMTTLENSNLIFSSKKKKKKKKCKKKPKNEQIEQ